VKRINARLVSTLLLLLTLCLLGIAQTSGLWTFGSRTLIEASAPVLTEATPIAIGRLSGAFLASIGGIAFDKTAVPAIPISDLALRYDRAASDGSRLKVTLNHQELTARLPDWRLVPIARYADSQYTACVTLFGHLNESASRDENQSRRGRFIINYHPDLANTLVGLRLFVLDHLLVDSDSADLPKLDHRYVLGLGETEPKVASGVQAYRAIEDILLEGDYDSYLISDYKRQIRFQPVNGELRLSGYPYYYFWSEGLGSTESKPVYEQELSDRISSRPEMLRAINPAAWDTGVAVMRYAAFFRYCKKNHPDAWRRLQSELAEVPVNPAITTPTVLPR